MGSVSDAATPMSHSSSARTWPYLVGHSGSPALGTRCIEPLPRTTTTQDAGSGSPPNDPDRASARRHKLLEHPVDSADGDGEVAFIVLQVCRHAGNLFG